MGCDHCNPDDCMCYPICDRYSKGEQKEVELQEHTNWPNCFECRFYNYDSEFWNNENIRTPESKSVEGTISNELEYLDSYETKGMYIELSNGVGFCDYTPTYNSNDFHHLAIDSENKLYNPKTDYDTILIFPEFFNTPFSGPANMVNWGGFWDYFLFPGGVSIDNQRGKI